MSLDHISWALRHAPVDNPVDLLVLLVLAEHANDEDLAWPSWQTLSDRTRCSRTTVWRRIRRLIEAGVIVRLDEGSAGTPIGMQRIREDRRPVCYRLTMILGPVDKTATGSQNETPSGDEVKPRGTERGFTGETNGVSLVKPKPRPEPRPVEEQSPKRGTSPVQPPRPVDNPAAREAWLAERHETYTRGAALAREAIALARQQREQAAR